MPKKNYTHLVLVVDHSGSMESMKVEATQGISTLISEQFALDGRFTLTLVEFNERAKTVARLAKEAPGYSLCPDGFTALLDAVGGEIAATDADIAAMKPAQRPERVVFVVITDGMENASQKHSLDEVRDLISKRREEAGWVFQFLGAGESAWQGKALGMDSSTYSGSDGSTTAVYGAVNASLSNLRSGAGSSATGLSMPENIV